MTIYAVLLFVFAAAAVFFAFRYDAIKLKKQKEKLDAHEAALLHKKTLYQNALLKDDKQLALKLGREYYSMFRNRNLTIYDEQAIANDLSAMK